MARTGKTARSTGGTGAGSNSEARELARFARHARDWWDPHGPFAPLHRLNPARLQYIREQAAGHFRLRRNGRMLEGLTVLDVGCGGGLVAEPLARMGATVLGIDLVSEGIFAAKAHAAGQDLALEYRCVAARALADEGRQFDLVTCLEVVEHVADPAAFLTIVAGLVRPEGLAVFSTLNRNAASLVLGKIAAEYILRWVPRGTHDWRKFLRPSELAGYVRQAGLQVTDVTGLNLHPTRGWRAEGPALINYLMTAKRPVGHQWRAQ